MTASLLKSLRLLSILAVFNNAVAWMVSTRSPTSKSSRPFNNHVITVPKAPIIISIIVTFMFHIFFNSLARSLFTFCGLPGLESRQFCGFSFFFFFLDYYKVWSLGRD